MNFEKQIKKLNINLPEAKPPVGSYVATKKTGNLLFISGQISINENGELVGVAVSGMSKEVTEGINFGIKSSATERFLNSNSISAKKSFFSSSKNNDELLKILEEGTVYTYCE